MKVLVSLLLKPFRQQTDRRTPTMPKLNDYLGQVVSAITAARMQSDLESVRLADQYASHPLLKHFSVPRFRVMNARLDIPIAVHGIAAPMASDGSRAAELEAVPKQLSETLDTQLSAAGIKLEGPSKERIDAAIHKHIEVLKNGNGLLSSTTNVADNISNAVQKELIASSALSETDRGKLVGQFRDAARTRLVKFQADPADIHVIVGTADLKNIAPPDLITRIQLTLTEEGMEWKQIESGGDTTSRLRPE